jgi:hypothetical protein
MVMAEGGYLYPLYARTAVADEPPSVASSAAVHTQRALLQVRCYDNWRAFDEALHYMTPGHTGVWDRVAFTRTNLASPDWIGVFDDPGDRSITIKHSPNRVFFAISEPPLGFLQKLHQGQGEGTTVLTCDEELCRSSDQKRRYILSPCMTPSWTVHRGIDMLRGSRVDNKPLRLSWVTSNKRFKSIVGHGRRMEFLAKLRGNLEFDLFGHGFRSIADKWEGLAPYRYSIAFENSYAPFYFTEKLMDCFVAETMPLYFGCPSITNFFPAESMVVIDPDDPDILAKIDEVIRSDLWQRRRDAVLEAKRLVLEEYNLFARLAKFVTGEGDTPLPPRRMRIKPVPVDWN